MVLAYTGTKGQPVAVANGASPTFAADLSELALWYQKGRAFRRAATQAALELLTNMENYDLGIVDAIPGAHFKYDGGTAKWKMIGTPFFTNAAARDAAITAPQTDMVTRIGTDRWARRYNGTIWHPFGAGEFPIVPTAIAGTGAVLSPGGLITLTACPTLNITTAFPLDFEDFRLRLKLTSKSAGGDASLRLRTSSTDAITGYTANRIYGSGSALTNDQVGTGSGTLLVLDIGTGSGRSSALVDILGPNLAGVTEFFTRAKGNAFNANNIGEHTTATSYQDMTLTIDGTKTMTGTVELFGVNKNAA